MKKKQSVISDSVVTDTWRRELKESGYETPKISRWDYIKFKLLTRAWRRILRHTRLRRCRSHRALEFGCGGGAHIVPLAVNGWACTGIDCSPEVLSRAQQYVKRVNEVCVGPKIDITLKCADFLNYKPPSEGFDLTFQFGVLEHFLDSEERFQYVRKMLDCTRPGGFIVSAVPNGCHVLRREQREKGLGGYNIPEIDYTPEMIIHEMEQAGGCKVKVLPHDLFGYLKVKDGSAWQLRTNRILYLLGQIPLPKLFPFRFVKRHAYWWIAIAKKPVIDNLAL